MRVDNRVIAITGGARGLGFAIAQRLGRQGAHVALLDRSAEALDDAVSALGAEGVTAQAFVVNVADEASVERGFADIAERMGPISGCVNNAGITDDGLLIKAKEGRVEKRMTLSSWQRVLDVNLTGVFLCGREAATQMIEAGHEGVIVNISSISRAGNMGQSNYAAAKAGVHALTVTWGKELARYGIRTGTVAPGFIDTDMTASMRPDMLEKIASSVPLQQLGEPDHIAQSVGFIFENDYFTARIIECDGGLRL
ncbi:MAG TPA: short chain dehydrogenase [Halomonas sp.]|uniref:SDR family oxidoreductase n=1 Tax=Halomonas sp. LC1 TaxID=3043733 RepID=UPI000C5B9CF4|nr:SDR family oxidoreductase [Halomonas sp. LC1]MAO63045.1 3-oxoacyl-ACP reductase [Halomonas sp.]MAO63187.1 3-oxoacyl-ACP reductase [Halomonas sp.]MDK9687134.1 SDR family oxidoreductase [Halomonas sp. LC1]HBM27556.1 short chain dehydrogenase [Halomonas sp.]|tara:strand:+ start:927 stop:1688 length:762 start_codon:yes stop_codon:yes gene_type:complete